MRLESYIEDLIRGKKKGIFASFLKNILLLFSFLFQGIVFLRNKAYDSGLLTKYRAPVPSIISIGNVVAGGTGKTPALLFLLQELNNENFKEDFKIAVLSRGYRASIEKQSFPQFLSQGNGPLHPASFAGDEPYLIAENFPKTIMVVGKNRHEAANMAAKAGAKLIILDDGMQHRHLARDWEIVLMDAEDPFGQDHFLPRGFLREPKSSLSRADLIILNHIRDEAHFIKLKSDLQLYTKAIVIGAQMKIEKLLDFSSSEIVSLKDKKVGIFCGIAKPDKFKATVLNEGAEILAEYFISDHLAFDPLKLEAFADSCRAKGAEMIVCTEKDKVKFPKNLKVSLPIVWVKVRLSLEFDQEEWKAFIQNAKRDIMRRM